MAIGRQDIDHEGLQSPPGIEILRASSDHLILDTGPTPLPMGEEVSFQLDYNALVRAMTPPFVTKLLK